MLLFTALNRTSWGGGAKICWAGSKNSRNSRGDIVHGSEPAQRAGLVGGQEKKDPEDTVLVLVQLPVGKISQIFFAPALLANFIPK